MKLLLITKSFLIKTNNWGDILIHVPLDEAPSFKQNWNVIKYSITPKVIPLGNDVVLTSLTIKNGSKEYLYKTSCYFKWNKDLRRF